jgi:hypothetical protein
VRCTLLQHLLYCGALRFDGGFALAVHLHCIR